MNLSKELKPVPEFKTLQEEAAFWDTRDSMEYELEATDEMVDLSDDQKVQIRERRKMKCVLMHTESNLRRFRHFSSL